MRCHINQRHAEEVIRKPWLITCLDAAKPETRLLGVDLNSLR